MSGDALLVVLVREVGAQAAARPAWMPWQPLPKTQFQREVSQVRSQRKTCSSSAGSGNSTHARAKSSPFSSGTVGSAWPFADFAGPVAALAREEPPVAAACAADLSAFAFFVFGTRPGYGAGDRIEDLARPGWQ
jgi:hypothetical protein